MFPLRSVEQSSSLYVIAVAKAAAQVTDRMNLFQKERLPGTIRSSLIKVKTKRQNKKIKQTTNDKNVSLAVFVLPPFFTFENRQGKKKHCRVWYLATREKIKERGKKETEYLKRKQNNGSFRWNQTMGYCRQ